jgi:hypothetical protein
MPGVEHANRPGRREAVADIAVVALEIHTTRTSHSRHRTRRQAPSRLPRAQSRPHCDTPRSRRPWTYINVQGFRCAAIRRVCPRRDSNARHPL